MSAKAPKTPHRAALLEENQDAITLSWAKLSQEIPGSRYPQDALAQVRTWLSLVSQATLKSLVTGS
jgi:hypothetical protein